jgi:hypothetical protein
VPFEAREARDELLAGVSPSDSRIRLKLGCGVRLFERERARSWLLEETLEVLLCLLVLVELLAFEVCDLACKGAEPYSTESKLWMFLGCSSGTKEEIIELRARLSGYDSERGIAEIRLLLAMDSGGGCPLTIVVNDGC